MQTHRHVLLFISDLLALLKATRRSFESKDMPESREAKIASASGMYATRLTPEDQEPSDFSNG